MNLKDFLFTEGNIDINYKEDLGIDKKEFNGIKKLFLELAGIALQVTNNEELSEEIVKKFMLNVRKSKNDLFEVFSKVLDDVEKDMLISANKILKKKTEDKKFTLSEILQKLDLDITNSESFKKYYTGTEFEKSINLILLHTEFAFHFICAIHITKFNLNEKLDEIDMGVILDKLEELIKTSDPLRRIMTNNGSMQIITCLMKIYSSMREDIFALFSNTSNNETNIDKIVKIIDEVIDNYIKEYMEDILKSTNNKRDDNYYAGVINIQNMCLKIKISLKGEIYGKFYPDAELPVLYKFLKDKLNDLSIEFTYNYQLFLIIYSRLIAEIDKLIENDSSYVNLNKFNLQPEIASALLPLIDKVGLLIVDGVCVKDIYDKSPEDFDVMNIGDYLTNENYVTMIVNKQTNSIRLHVSEGKELLDTEKMNDIKKKLDNVNVQMNIIIMPNRRKTVNDNIEAKNLLRKLPDLLGECKFTLFKKIVNCLDFSILNGTVMIINENKPTKVLKDLNIANVLYIDMTENDVKLKLSISNNISQNLVDLVNKFNDVEYVKNIKIEFGDR